ncbi:hypothetical protein PF005_g11284 [Phytophthora fragariae]|uniref:Secreted protein n=2 Tax=Phytophthora TaxID=4783 RepID=A0A6A3XYZ6_9STRA|nr:hypothetical protein PF003_g2753 [Phytophthora fragariae]KAE9033220.1 hypothetical protein PR001_g10253 [Phytophthora rubi]KAE8937585.1 hypothetical protein PF009_g12517 [Phytophthora fragariae]KAE9009932.1 hypothetical protein PF011_g10040 [Phytophthora fragariae]KAE9033718.1 hypothetical protein PR002_g8513 [Phytophthora rubi]
MKYSAIWFCAILLLPEPASRVLSATSKTWQPRVACLVVMHLRRSRRFLRLEAFAAATGYSRTPCLSLDTSKH